MSGTKSGASKATATIYAKYGKDYFRKQGAKGGRVGRTGGFASSHVGPDGLTGPERAMVAGSRGGQVSRRKPGTSAESLKQDGEAHRKRARSLNKTGASREYIAELLGRSIEWVDSELDVDSSKKAA